MVSCNRSNAEPECDRLPAIDVFKKMLSNPIIITIACIALEPACLPALLITSRVFWVMVSPLGYVAWSH